MYHQQEQQKGAAPVVLDVIPPHYNVHHGQPSPPLSPNHYGKGLYFSRGFFVVVAFPERLGVVAVCLGGDTCHIRLLGHLSRLDGLPIFKKASRRFVRGLIAFRRNNGGKNPNRMAALESAPAELCFRYVQCSLPQVASLLP